MKVLLTLLVAASLVGTAIATGACDNDHDRTTCMNHQTMLEAVITCGIEGESDIAAIQSCISNMAHVSSSCSLCYATEFHCTFESCEQPCVANPMSVECLECSRKNCSPAFEQCAGVKAPVEVSVEASQGKCLDAADSAKCHDDDAMIAITSKCGLSCRGDRQCTTECVEKAAHISEPCADCYGQDAACTRSNCMFKCMFNPNAPQCQECAYQYCGDAFKQCSGITPKKPGSLVQEIVGDQNLCLDAADSAICNDAAKMIKITSDCGLQCRGSRSCTTECVESAAHISEPCADCFGQDAACALKNCMFKCMSDPNCYACQECTYEACGQSFHQCSGIVPIQPQPSAEEVTAMATVTNACVNPSDEAKCAHGALNADVRSCSMKCMGDGDCVARCLVQNDRISQGCSQCFGAEVQCGRDNCMSECLMNPSSSSCLSCVASHCGAAFQSCSGLTTLHARSFLASGHCTDADRAKLSDATAIDAQIKTCAKSCWGEGSCASKCIAKATGLSDACSQCYGTEVQCGRDNCESKCLFNPDGSSCRSCVASHCTPALNQCTGISSVSVAAF